MKKILFIVTAGFLLSACTTQKNLSYLNNLPQSSSDQIYSLDAPDYKIQNRDILYITLKAINPEGMIVDYLSVSGASGINTYFQGEGGGYIYGYNVNKDGNIQLPVVGSVQVEGKTLDEIRIFLQEEFDRHYKNAVVDCKLLSFKYTVIGEVRNPGTFVNYNNYLTILEAISRAGGINDYGKRDNILVVRSKENKVTTYALNLHNKDILASEAYFLLPNDVIIVDQQKTKIFNMNLPTISFVLSTITGVITTTLLLINYFN